MLKHFYKILLLVGFFVLLGTWNASAEIWGIHGNFWEGNQTDSWSSRNMSRASDGTWVYSGYFYQGNFLLQQKDDNDSQPTWWSDPSSNTTITPGQSKTLTTSGKDLWLGTAGYYTFKFNPSTKVLTLTSGLSETPLYILSNDSGSWVLDKATATLTSDNTYSGTYTGSLEITSENAHIIFSTKLADSKEGWNNLSSTRYVPSTKGDVTPSTFPYNGYITQATDGSYILSQGTYNFSVNFNTKAITITKEKEPEVVVIPDIYIVGDNINGNKSWDDAVAANKMTYDEASKTYTWSGSQLGSGFKFNGGDWNTYNIGTTSDQELEIGQAYSVASNSDTQNIKFTKYSYIENPVVTLSLENMTVTVTGKGILNYPDQLYMIITGDGNENWLLDKGVKMEKNGTSYSGIVEINTDQDYTHLIFSDKTVNNWDEINKYRFVPNTDNDADVELDFSENRTYNGSIKQGVHGSYKLVNARYEVTVNLADNTVVIERISSIYPKELYLIGTIPGAIWSPLQSAQLELTDTRKGIFTLVNQDLALDKGQMGFSFASNQSDTWEGLETRFGTLGTKDVFITFDKEMPLHQTAADSHDGSFMWYAGGLFNITVSFENEQPTVLVHAEEFTYPDVMYVYGNVQGQRGDWEAKNYVEMTRIEDGVYVVKDLAVSNKTEDKLGSITFASNDPLGDNGDVSWKYILPRFAAKESVTLVPDFKEGASSSIVVDTEVIEKEEKSISLPEGHYDITLDLSNEFGANPIATFFPASVAVALGLTSEDTSSQSGEITENDEIHMVTIKDCVLLYVEGPKDSRVFYKLQNVNKLEKTETTSRVAPYAEADEADGYKEALPNQDVGGKKTVTLDTDTQGELLLYYEHEGITSQPRTYTFKVETGIPTSIDFIEATEEGEAVYYNLQGVKVSNPANGIFIKVVGGKSEKVYINK